MMRDTSFTALAVHQLRTLRYCGDSYPLVGWPGVNKALAQYALEKRQRKEGRIFLGYFSTNISENYYWITKTA